MRGASPAGPRAEPRLYSGGTLTALETNPNQLCPASTNGVIGVCDTSGGVSRSSGSPLGRHLTHMPLMMNNTAATTASVAGGTAIYSFVRPRQAGTSVPATGRVPGTEEQQALLPLPTRPLPTHGRDPSRH